MKNTVGKSRKIEETEAKKVKKLIRLTKMRHAHNFIIQIILLFSIFSCNPVDKKSDISEKESYKIYDLLINQFDYLSYGINLPPPPLGSNSFTLKKHAELIDSITKASLGKKLKISVDSTLYGKDSDEYQIYEEYKEFEPLVKKLEEQLPPSKLNIEKLSYNRKKLKIDLFDEAIFNQDKEAYFSKYRFILNFSRIAFNDNYTMAVVTEGITTTRMDAQSSITFLKKKKGKWKVVGGN